MKDTQRDINAKDAIGRTPLHVAAARNWHRKAADLLSQGADVNAKNDKDETPLHAAAAKNASQVAEVLLEHGAKFVERAMHTAAASGSPEVIDTLLAYGADIETTNDFGWTPLHSAVCCGGSDFVKQRHYYSPAVDRLLTHGANVRATDQFGWTPLHTAAWCDRSAVIEMLLNHTDGKAARDHNGLTPLHVAAVAGGGGVDAVEMLLTHGADIHAIDNSGTTPLHIAVARKPNTYINFILQHSTLHYWHHDEPSKSVAVVEMLLTHGADIYAPDHNNFTPLHLAAKENRLPIVKRLCQHAGSTWDTWYLDRPVTELGLTARVSNILARYGISTCRDLFITTEEELLTYNNFGPVALTEIKTQLAKAELIPGMPLGDEYIITETPIAALQLSVRASRCLETVNIKTIRQLVRKSEKDLLEYKNFGRTSINEIKYQLSNIGLTLGMNLEDGQGTHALKGGACAS